MNTILQKSKSVLCKTENAFNPQLNLSDSILINITQGIFLYERTPFVCIKKTIPDVIWLGLDIWASFLYSDTCTAAILQLMYDFITVADETDRQ